MTKQRDCGSHHVYPTPSPQMSQRFCLQLKGEHQSIKLPPRLAVRTGALGMDAVMLLSTGYQTLLGMPPSSGLHDPGRICPWLSRLQKKASHPLFAKVCSAETPGYSVSCSPCFRDSLLIHLCGHQTSPLCSSLLLSSSQAF